MLSYCDVLSCVCYCKLLECTRKCKLKVWSKKNIYLQTFPFRDKYRDGKWAFQNQESCNLRRISLISQSPFLLAVMCISQSRSLAVSSQSCLGCSLCLARLSKNSRSTDLILASRTRRYLKSLTSQSPGSWLSLAIKKASQNVSGSQRKTLISPSREVSHLPFTGPKYLGLWVFMESLR